MTHEDTWNHVSVSSYLMHSLIFDKFGTNIWLLSKVSVVDIKWNVEELSVLVKLMNLFTVTISHSWFFFLKKNKNKLELGRKRHANKTFDVELAVTRQSMLSRWLFCYFLFLFKFWFLTFNCHEVHSNELGASIPPLMSNSIWLIITYILYDHPLLCKNQLHYDEYVKQILFISTKFEEDQRS